MPRSLPARWQPESIREFRAAALRRYEEGISLALAGREYRTGAIYLWGYAAEMTLKAAYFRLLGLAETAVIGWGANILPAINRGRNVLGVVWPVPGQGHNVRAWADLLIAERAAMLGAAYAPVFGLQVQECGQNIGSLWSETLRYHKNVAYLYELRRVREAVEWLLVNDAML
jgi:hypothetical protein